MRSRIYSFIQKFDFFIRLNRDNLRVLAYHDVPDKEKFECQLTFLCKHYNVISLEELYNSLFHGHTLPERPVLITFDDGDVSVLNNGFPVLAKYKLPSVLFTISGLIDSKEAFWCRGVENSYIVDGKSYGDARKKVQYLKEVPNKERVDYLKSIKKVYSRQLTRDELNLLKINKMFIANHTHTHPMLNNCTDSEIEEELNQVKLNFERWNLDGYVIFAYPNGNWDERTEKLLQDNGIKMAFLFDHKINKRTINPMRISRIKVDADTEMNEFKVKVSGLHSLLMSVKAILKNDD